MNDIKTKESVVGNSIKVLDKSANLSDRMKNVYIRTTQSAEHSYYAEENSPEEYAFDKVTETSEAIGHEAVYQFDEHGRKGFETTKENIIKAKEHFEHGDNSRAHSASYGSESKEDRQYTGGPSYKTQYNSPKSNPQECAKEYAVKQAEKRTERIYEQRTAESVNNTIKTKESAQASADFAKSEIKTRSSVFTAKETAVKGGKTTIKTAERTSKATVKTTKATTTASHTVVKTPHTIAPNKLNKSIIRTMMILSTPSRFINLIFSNLLVNLRKEKIPMSMAWLLFIIQKAPPIINRTSPLGGFFV